MSTATESDSTANSIDLIQVQRAIISVSDKTGLAEFAQVLSDLKIEILSTGGTRRHLEQAGIPVRDVAEYTGFPEMMDGRVKTLHPKIFAGILSRRDHPQDMQSMEEHQIVPVDLVVVNLYPFESTVANPEVTIAEAVEQVDIGGPSLVRAAAKNHQFVTIVTDPSQYESVIGELHSKTGIGLPLRQRLMAEAFQHTAAYDAAIADYFSETFGGGDDNREEDQPLPQSFTLQLKQRDELRYGENHHQPAAVYSNSLSSSVNSIVEAKQLNGKQLSYNNYLDLDSAFSIVADLEWPSCAVIKHNNPCGAASADRLSDAVARAFAGDPVSAFGSVVAMNREIDAATARWMGENKLFVEAIVAPGFSDDAFEILTTRPKWKKNVRLMATGSIEARPREWHLRQIQGGMLVQQVDCEPIDRAAWQVVTEMKPDEELLAELRFAWGVVRHVKSNAITLSRQLALVGVGAGQMSRVDAVHIAIDKAGDRSYGSVLASDAFFPFPDSIALAAKAGISAVIQPGGSVNDEQVIEACNTNGIPMVFTGTRHFKH